MNQFDKRPRSLSSNPTSSTISHVDCHRWWCPRHHQQVHSVETGRWQGPGVLEFQAQTVVRGASRHVLRTWLGWCADLGSFSNSKDATSHLVGWFIELSLVLKAMYTDNFLSVLIYSCDSVATSSPSPTVLQAIQGGCWRARASACTIQVCHWDLERWQDPLLPSKPVGWPGYDECEAPGDGSGLPWQLQPDWAKQEGICGLGSASNHYCDQMLIWINPVWCPLGKMIFCNIGSLLSLSQVSATTSVPPKVLPVKPKFWLTCSCTLAGKTWYKVTSALSWIFFIEAMRD